MNVTGRIYVGIDDTDTLDSPGTNQLARAIVRDLADEFVCDFIIRHQLSSDPRVPCTSQNGSASMLFRQRTTTGDFGSVIEHLQQRVRAGLLSRFVEGSDPGLCITAEVPADVVHYARRCQQELVTQTEARTLAESLGISLEGLGGTEDGVIGALAAIGLAKAGDDGRVVHIGDWSDDLSGLVSTAVLMERKVRILIDDGMGHRTDLPMVTTGIVDVGKHLRPNYRQHQATLYVRTCEKGDQFPCQWVAVRYK